MTTVGDRIRRLREDVGLDRRECAARAGISQTMLSDFETGKRDPGIGAIASLAATLGCFMSTIEGRSEVLDRLETAARTRNSDDQIDSSSVTDRLGFFIELDERLRLAEIGTVS